MDAHNLKKMNIDALKAFRDRFHIPVADEDIADLPFYKPADDSPEMQYLQQRRAALGGHLPQRLQDAPLLQVPDLDMFDGLLKNSGERELSTTMAFVRMISTLLRDKKLGKYIVPIVADEARTFGMEGLFKTYAIYSSVGQLFEEADKGSMMSYREAEDGQIMEEGICEAGAMSSWIAAGTAYSHHETQMIPFYIFYSMFGFQRIGDLIWAGADMQARGFLLGGTAGRTTLNGEGLQHQDGNSHLIAGTVPNCISYDPTFAYELAVIVHDGLRRMYQEGERIFYYITVMNEKYSHPEIPKGAEAGILKGMYRFSKSRKKADVQLMGSGTILREVIAAAELLQQDFNLSADVWSVTSYNELRREAENGQRWNRLHPNKKPKISYVEQCLSKTHGPVIASSDYVKALPESIRFVMPRAYTVLGTDGFGRSDSREQLRAFFEVDRFHVVIAALKALVDEDKLSVDQLQQAIRQYGIDAEKPNPITV